MNIQLSATRVSRDRWLVSYADFMTLLCAFFTALYAGSLAETRAALAAVAPAPPAAAVAPAPEGPPVPGEAEQLRHHVEDALQAELAAGYLQLVDDPRGLVIEVPEAGSFAVGQADLTPDAARMLGRVAAVLAGLPNGVRVEGHTDDRPIRTARFESNWDLSTARATRVVEFFILDGGLAADRLSAAGYSEFRPRADNATAEGRARNRRVDVVILNGRTERTEEPPAHGSAPAPRGAEG
ncbi:MAG: OmpA family protein [Vicinamibacterales bacterium]